MTKGGYAIIDAKFITAAEWLTLLGGGSITVSNQFFNNCDEILSSDKPIFAAMVVPSTGEPSTLLAIIPKRTIVGGADIQWTFGVSLGTSTIQIKLYYNTSTDESTITAQTLS